MASNNMMEILKMIRGGTNPQQMAMNMLGQVQANDPLTKNLIELAQKKDSKGMIQVARNAFKEQGKDFDKEFSDFRKQFGL